jgi:hypothetical protein
MNRKLKIQGNVEENFARFTGFDLNHLAAFHH